MSETKKPLIPKNAKKILADARDPEVSSAYTFIVGRKEYDFNRAQSLTDEELINAIVIDRYGYYLRRGLQDVKKKREHRHSSNQDWVKDEYKVTIEYIDADEAEEYTDKVSIISVIKSLFK